MIERDALPATHLFLVRHGETEFNRLRMVQGRGVDVPLNAAGKAQADALAVRTATLNLDAIYASTLIRARETAMIAAKASPDIPLFFLRDLEEMSWGVFEGQQSSPELLQAFDVMRSEWSSGNYAYRAEQGESIFEVQKRGRRAITHIVEKHAGRRILVIAHGRFLRVLLATLLQDFGLERMEDIQHANTGLNHLIYSEGVYEARLLNCTIHLENEIAPA